MIVMFACDYLLGNPISPPPPDAFPPRVVYNVFCLSFKHKNPLEFINPYESQSNEPFDSE